MNDAEFLKAVKKLEGAYEAPWKKDAQFLEERDYKRLAIQEAIAAFPEDTVRDAFRTLAAESERFPTVHGIVEACREAEQHKAPSRTYGHDRFQPAAHECTKVQLPHSEALRLLRRMSAYEAHHIACGADVKATCPKCGTLHGPVENPMVVDLMRRYAEETKDWHANFKGRVLCPKCEGREAT